MDLAVTKTGVDKAITFANQFFLALEGRDHRVVIAPNSERLHRADVDERENPGNSNHHSDLWSPMRCMVVYIGTVAIGLTIIEMSEEAEARHLNGEYVRQTFRAASRPLFGSWRKPRSKAPGSSRRESARQRSNANAEKLSRNSGAAKMRHGGRRRLEVQQRGTTPGHRAWAAAKRLALPTMESEAMAGSDRGSACQ